VGNAMERYCTDVVVNPVNLSPESENFDWRNPEHWALLGETSTSESGVTVSPSTAFQVASFWQAVSMISGDIAGMPLDVYKRDAITDDRDVDWTHPAEFLVSSEANEDTPAFEFWRRIVAHALVWPAGYAWIDRRGPNGDPMGLYNLLPDRTRPVYDANGMLYYQTEVDGEIEYLRKWEVLCVKGLSLENNIGLHLLEKSRNELGLALAARGFASKFFDNGAKAGGLLEIPANFTEKAAKNLEEGFRITESKAGWFKTVILREGAKFHQLTVTPADSKLNELREHEAREVARFFNLPPFKLGLADSVSYNSATVGQQVYLLNTLNPWRHAIVGEANMKLLTRQQRRTMSHYFEHNPSKMLEIDPSAMNAVLEIQRRNEIINANEWRRKIGLNARPGGDEYINPNTKSAEPAKPQESTDEPPNDKARASLKGAFADAVNRVARRVSVDARRHAKKQDKFLAWIDSKAQDHRAVFAEAAWPMLRVVADLYDEDANLMLMSSEGRFFGDLLDRLRPLVEPPHQATELAASVDAACAAFENEIAAKLEPLVFGGDA